MVTHTKLTFQSYYNIDGLNGGRQMIRNPDTSEGQPLTVFTAPPVKYDDSKFIPVPVKKGLLSFKNPKNFTFFYTWLFLKFELIVNPLVCSRSSCHLLSVWKSSFPFLSSTVCALSNSVPLYFVHVQAAWWSFTEKWFTRVNTTSRTSPGRSTPSICLIKRTPPTASRTGGYKTCVLI